jgi:C4-dicarboxylate-specific signal transduction histidine kinase
MPAGLASIDINTLLMAAILSVCAWMVRAREGRDQRQDSQQVLLAALESRFEERFKTIFADVREIKDDFHDLRKVMDELRVFMASPAPSPPRRRRA